MRGEGQEERDEMNRRGHNEYAECSTGTVLYRRYFNFLNLQYVDFRLG